MLSYKCFLLRNAIPQFSIRLAIDGRKGSETYDGLMATMRVSFQGRPLHLGHNVKLAVVTTR